MIYLASCQNFVKPVRLQVYKSLEGWVANIIGEKRHFIKPMDSYEDVVHALFECYDSITLSKRRVDFKNQHIVLLDNLYYILDENGNDITDTIPHFNQEHRIVFTSDGTLKSSDPILDPHGDPIPDYYANAKPFIDNSSLWTARDIDYGLWVCFDINQPELLLSQSKDQYTSIYDGLSKHLKHK